MKLLNFIKKNTNFLGPSVMFGYWAQVLCPDNGPKCESLI